MAVIREKTDDTGAVKVLRRNLDDVVVRVYSNTDTITLLSDKIKVTDSSGNGVENWAQSVGYNSSNMTVHSGVTLPDGYIAKKFTYDGTTWAQDSNWESPVGLLIGPLVSSINESATSLNIINIKMEVKVNDTIQIENEKLTIVSIVDTDNCTVARGAASTTAASHDAAKLIYKV
jgi:hypothetical protein